MQNQQDENVETASKHADTTTQSSSMFARSGKQTKEQFASIVQRRNDYKFVDLHKDLE
jgi:hypothetical protein